MKQNGKQIDGFQHIKMQNVIHSLQIRQTIIAKLETNKAQVKVLLPFKTFFDATYIF